MLRQLSAIAVCLPLLLLSCSEGGLKRKLIPYKPKSLFDKEVRTLTRINLAEYLADTLVIANGKEEKIYSISFNRKTKINEIIELGSGLHFSGTATKHKQLIFLNELKDSLYAVKAFTIEGNEIIGFDDLVGQQKKLDQRVKSGLHEGLLTSTEKGRYVLSVRKNKLLILFSSLLLESEAWTIKTKG